MKLTILSFLILFFLSNTAVSEDITYTEGDFSYYMTNEGAGYAGGITSAAVDGVKVAEYMAVTAACMG